MAIPRPPTPNWWLQHEGQKVRQRKQKLMRSAATTEVPTNSTELGAQMARLMAALTRAEQDNHPHSAPNSPRHRGMGEGRWMETLLSAQAPTMAGLA